MNLFSIYFACSHYLVLMINVGLRKMRKVRDVLIVVFFGHIESDCPRKDNRKKEEKRGKANIATMSSYDQPGNCMCFLV